MNQWVRRKRNPKILANRFGLNVVFGSLGGAGADLETQQDGGIDGFKVDLSLWVFG